jgi:hypothetical protein
VEDAAGEIDLRVALWCDEVVEFEARLLGWREVAENIVVDEARFG